MIRSPSDRAESTQLSHLFGVAMTAVLITVILTGAADYVQNERADVAQTQLETIGNRLAAEVEQVDELGRQGGQASARMQVQSTVAGENYDARIGTGDTCETGNFDSNRCLVLETIDEAAQAKVPLNVSADFSIRDEGSGVFRLVVDGDGSRSGTAAVVDRQLRIGVGEDFEGNRYGEVVDPTNRPPIAEIDFSPEVPRSRDPVQFTAVNSLDPDGRIVTYKWDFDNDGDFEVVGEGPNVTRDLSAGPHRVRLQVVDNADPRGARSNATLDLRVSGLAYEGDLDNSEEGEPGAVSFTVTNEWATEVDSSIELTQIMIEPEWTSSDGYEINNACGYTTASCPYGPNSNDGEIVVDAGLNGGGAEGVGYIQRDPDSDATTEIPPDGVIVELETPVSMFSGESARIWVGSFLDTFDLSGKEFDIGVRYEVDGKRNSTVFTDIAGSATIEEYRLETDGDEVNAIVVSNKRLNDIRIELGAGLSGPPVDSIGTVTELPNGNFEHEVYLGDLEDGVGKANLTVARNDSVSAFKTQGPRSMNRSVAVFRSGAAWTWSNESDWNAAANEDGVVHAAYGTNQPDQVRIGYSDSGTGLVGYWPFDGSADDVAGSLDGTEVDVGTARGVYGSSSYTFDGDDDYVRIGSQFGNIHSDTSSLSMWVKTNAEGDWGAGSSPGITGYIDGYNDRLVWGWLDTESRLNVGSDEYSWRYGRLDARSGATIDDGQWHHVVMTYEDDTGEVKMYVDGERNDGYAYSNLDGAFSDIGRVAGGEYFNGRIDEVRSYDRVLSQSDVDELSDGVGSMTTGWKDGTNSLDLSNLVVQYDANVSFATEITVTVEAYADNGTRVESDPVRLDDGGDSVAVEGLGNGTASRYRLTIEFETESPYNSPVLDKIGVREDS
jgi:hypothetical protein